MENNGEKLVKRWVTILISIASMLIGIGISYGMLVSDVKVNSDHRIGAEEKFLPRTEFEQHKQAQTEQFDQMNKKLDILIDKLIK